MRVNKSTNWSHQNSWIARTSGIILVAMTFSLSTACTRSLDVESQGLPEKDTNQGSPAQGDFHASGGLLPGEDTSAPISIGSSPADSSAGSLGTGNPADQSNGSTAVGSASTSSVTGGQVTVRYKDFNADFGDAMTDEQYRQKVNQWVEAHRARGAGELGQGGNASEYRYTFIPRDILKDKELANIARVGVSKAINSVAPRAEKIVSPIEISEGYGAVYALHLPSFWQDRWQQKWGRVSSGVNKQIFAAAPRQHLAAFNGDEAVAADRLTYNVLHGGIYNDLVDAPGRGQELIRRIKAGPPQERLGVNNAITLGPRYIQRRELADWEGSYWESHDEFFPSGSATIRYLNGNIPRFRGDGMVADYGTVASEAWNHMPNGLIAYYVWGNANQQRTRAEQSFVVDPLNLHNGGWLITGFCVFCHAQGPYAHPNDVWTAIENGTIRGGDNARLREFWTSNEKLDEVFDRDRKIFQRAMKTIVYSLSDGDIEFNDSLVLGTNRREPTYYLAGRISRSRDDGIVADGNSAKQRALNARGIRSPGGGGGRNGGGGGW